nr:glycosyltransferase family 2 protein [uncultured Clostridium sp.]
MSNIKVSVIMPMLNSIEYLAECMKSVCNQTLKDIEIICVDAGSKDGTIELIFSYMKTDKRIILIQSEKKSYGAQVNLGIQMAKGEYIGIVESDDYISLDMYQNLYRNAKENKPDFIKGGYIQFGDINNTRFYEKTCKKDDNMNVLIDLNLQPKYRLFDPVHIWTGLYKKDFLLKNSIQLNETSGASYQDTGFSILVGAFAGTCMYTVDCDYYYRIDNSNSSVKSDFKTCSIVEEYDYVYRKLRKSSVDTDFFEEELKKYKLISYFWNYRRLSSKGRREFLARIYHQMDEYIPVLDKLTEADQRILYYLSVFDREEEYNKFEYQQYTFLESVRNLLNNNHKCVCVSAGYYAERFVSMQAIIGARIIEAVCDNNVSIRGMDFHGYQIITVEEAVNIYKELTFVIVNKKYAYRIKEQLLSLGVGNEQIVIPYIFPDFVSVIEYFKNAFQLKGINTNDDEL